MDRNNETIRLAKKAADAWRNTDTYHQAAQIIDMLISALEGDPTLPPAERAADAGRQINAQNGDLSERMERSTGYPLLLSRLQKSCEKGRGVLP